MFCAKTEEHKSKVHRNNKFFMSVFFFCVTKTGKIKYFISNFQINIDIFLNFNKQIFIGIILKLFLPLSNKLYFL